MKMEYYGIKTPGKPEQSLDSYVWWISNSEHNAWMSFFTSSCKQGTYNAHALPLIDAIRAYKGIGYQCVKLNIEIIKE